MHINPSFTPKIVVLKSYHFPVAREISTTWRLIHNLILPLIWWNCIFIGSYCWEIGMTGGSGVGDQRGLRLIPIFSQFWFRTTFISSTDLDSFAARLRPWLGFKSRRGENKSRGCRVEEGRGVGEGDAQYDVAAFSVLFPRKMAILCGSKSPVDWIAMKWSHGNLLIGSHSVPLPSWNPSRHALLQIPTASLPISVESPFSLRGISLPINFLLYSV